jgi:LuxR family transcriptional regulator, maltose regulon positive regulatory protein
MIIETKIIRPNIDRKLIERQRIATVLDSAAAVPFSVLQAPAGFGKTTAAVQWTVERGHRCAWLSLDRYDNDLAKFWQYLYYSCRRLGVRQNKTVEALFDEPGALSVHPCSTYLINELTLIGDAARHDDPLFIVLDDFHVISHKAVINSVGHFLDFLPAGVHVLILSRTAPKLALAQRRIRSQVLEIGAEQLSFDYAECERFLRESARRDLPAATIRSIYDQTCGWIAAVKLAGISAQDGQRSGAVPHGIHTEWELYRYFAEQVFDPLEPGLKSFLIATALLPKFTVELCDDLACFSKPAMQLIEEVESAGLFLLSLGADRAWFRYCDLFKELVAQSIKPADRAQLSGTLARTVDWFVDRDLFEDALEIAILIKDWHRVVDLFECIVPRFFQSGIGISSFIHLDKIPQHVILSSPQLALFYARSVAHRGRQAQVQKALDAGERQVREYLRCYEHELPVDTSSLGAFRLRSRQECLHLLTEILLSRALARAAAHDLEGEIRLLREISTLGCQHDEIQAMKVDFCMARTIAYGEGDFPRCIEYLERSIDIGFKHKYLEYIIFGTMELLLKSIYLGRIDAALAWSKRTWEWLERQGWAALPELRLLKAAELAVATFQMDVERAERLAGEVELALAPGSMGMNYDYVLYEQVIIARYLAFHYLAQERYDRAFALLRQIEQASNGFDLDRPYGGSLGISVNAFRAKVALQAGMLDAAQAWAEKNELRLLDSRSYMLEGDRLILVAVHVHGRRFKKVSELLFAIRADAERQGRVLTQLKTYILEALFYFLSGRTAQAAGITEAAVKLAYNSCRCALPFVEEGAPMRELLGSTRFVGKFASYRDQLLQHFAAPAAPAAVAVVDMTDAKLTDRELEIIVLIKQGATDKAIAEMMHISTSTVKYHLQNIFRKLNVRTRTAAVFVAEKKYTLDWKYPRVV